MKRLLNILPILILTACDSKPKKQVDNTSFTPPIVYQEKTNDTINFFKVEFISTNKALYIGKSGFCDTLKLSIERSSPDTSIHDDRIFDDYYSEIDSFGLDGLEILPDYESTVSKIYYTKHGNYYYPVYIVNQTPNTKLFIGKTSNVFAIQEAQDDKGYWRPIEGRGFDFCGLGYWGLKLFPNEFITVLFPKYEGDYKTNIRVRIENEDIIYVSKPFEGTIDKRQFILYKENWRGGDRYYKWLIEDEAKTIQNTFYGSVPLELEDKNFRLLAE